uniref:peptidylprolyl isomerase n=1 Tax=Hippocampus comes TaxID=109280 RepID=A0A3Q2YJ30_HIPCM
MLLPLLSWLCSSLVAAVYGGALPEAEVKLEVLHKPFLCHRKSKYGDMMLVHHQGYFENGTMFHDSRGDPTEGDKHAMWFILGIREVIKGWDQGLQNMCAGEKRKLIVPPALAYGKEGKGTVEHLPGLSVCPTFLLCLAWHVVFFYLACKPLLF